MVNEQVVVDSGCNPGCGLPFGGFFIWIFWLFFLFIILSFIFRPIGTPFGGGFGGFGV